MKNLKQYSLDLSGYADRQGEEKFNQTLSQSRADAVKNFLVSQGIDSARIATKAFGESQPLNNVQTVQSDFFDRRVMMKLSPGTSAVAKN
ncbi:MAG: OmpA family protein [Psychrosphaera sp.]|nr:OmpA family protein [Psychrosphaera sp.]